MEPMFNWNPKSRPVYISNGIYGYERLSDYKAIVRDDTNTVLNLTKSSYESITNNDFEDIINQLLEADCKLLNYGSFKEGRLIFAQLKNELLSDSHINGDEMRNILTLVNSHDGSMALRLMFTTIRIWCMNTFTAAVKRGENLYESIRHTKSAPERMQTIKDNIQAVAEISRQLKNDFIAMSNTLIEDNDLQKSFSNIIKVEKKPRPYKENGITKWTEPKYSTKAENILTDLNTKYLESGAAGTVWGMFNSITDYAKKYDSDLYGTGKLIRDRAYKEAVNYLPVEMQ